jgi:hypothetical protein
VAHPGIKLSGGCAPGRGVGHKDDIGPVGRHVGRKLGKMCIIT